jgi:membrane protein DedA with SNARE-associated domain
LLHIPATLAYITLFLLVAGESAGIPIPGETGLSTAAVLAARGRLDLTAVIGIAAVAAVVGDNIGYLAGRRGGRRLLLCRGIAASWRRQLLEQSEAFYQERRGSVTVFVTRWLPVLRFTAALLAGANRMDRGRFLLWNALGGACWATSIGLLGYTIGARAGDAIRALGAVGATILILTGLGHLAWRWLRPAPTDTGVHFRRHIARLGKRTCFGEKTASTAKRSDDRQHCTLPS